MKLNQLTVELNTTKTDIIEKAINMFAQKRQKNKNNLLKYAGILKESEADKLLESIQENITISNKATHFTNNLKHFKRIDNLEIINL